MWNHIKNMLVIFMDNRLKIYLVFIIVLLGVFVMNQILFGDSPSDKILDLEEQLINHVTGIKIDLNPQDEN